MCVNYNIIAILLRNIKKIDFDFICIKLINYFFSRLENSSRFNVFRKKLEKKVCQKTNHPMTFSTIIFTQ